VPTPIPIRKSPARGLRRYALWLPVIGMACVLTTRLTGQHSFPYQKAPNSTIPGMGDVNPAIAAQQMRALNAERQKSLVSDTEKLLKLVKEFNEDVDSNRDQLTQVELHKLADIEKLARNVKQKMSVSFAGAPDPQAPTINPIP
jgi:hypothetical protein